MRRLIVVAMLVLSAVPQVQAILRGESSDTFLNPSSRVRPRFRYWLPDASVDADIVAQDVASAASVGAGGLEFVPFYEYGGSLGQMPTGANWSTYNFGTPAFNALFERVLRAHDEHGLVMDFALGPNQGQGVPAKPDDQGLQWDMVPFTEAIPRKDIFTGKIPGWGAGDLVSLVSALVESDRIVTYTAAGAVGLQNVTYTEYRLNPETLTELTKHVDQWGSISLTLPQAPKGKHYRLFAFYERLAGHKNLSFNSFRHATIFDDGSYAVDHFSSNGATVIRKFWAEHILSDEVLKLLSKVGNYAWEDSLELTFNVTWSRSLPDLFKKVAGYSLKPFLPLMVFQQNNLATQATEPGSFKCILDRDDEGVGYVNDFRAALVEGYKQYISALASWTREVLGVQLSAQPAYGSNMDMLAAVPIVDAPECESLSFHDNIDSYRAFAGPARLAGRRVVSNEMGALRGGGFQYHLPELIFSINRAFSGGVNQNVIHGQPYSGRYFNTTWPGYTPFRYLFSEPWSTKMPAWHHGLGDVMNYTARVQHILQRSVAKADVVIYNKESATTIRTIYQADDLLSEGEPTIGLDIARRTYKLILVTGWSSNYLTAENLYLKEAYVKNGVLAPDGPAWKAFILEASQYVTFDTVKILRSWAQQGLPVIISGGRPKYYATGGKSAGTEFERQLSSLLRTRNVHSVSSGKVAGKLRSLGLRPQVAVSTNGTCYTSWSEAKGTAYAIIYSDLTAAEGNIVIATTQTPYFLNPWTGETFPVLVYRRTKTTTIVPFSLAGNQTLILGFGENLEKTISAPRYHAENMPSNLVGSRVAHDGSISLHVARSANPSKINLSDGRIIRIDASSIPPTFRLNEWNLTAEHWEAPNDLYDSGYTVRYNTTHYLNTPTSWSEIKALANTSGVGYYTTTFQWPPNGPYSGTTSLGAYISFSRVVDSIKVIVNGHQIAAIDITNAMVDIGTHLKVGQNRITVIVPTTMWNYVRTVLDELVTAGSKPLPVTLQQLGVPLEPRSEAGLIGKVLIIPYKPILV
ncbi:Ff.00g039230.m01.CDS01 [Fusarium sp. VM40]|nr:Ff.00g039230.m01.CDS01 [Fusarium sp. VM40]